MADSERSFEKDGSMDSEYAGGKPRNVYLLVTPLQCYHRYQLQRVDFLRARCPNNRVPFKRLQHWAIQVGEEDQGEVYEVTSYYRTDHVPELKMSSAVKWRESRQKHLRFCRKLFITVTERTTQQLEKIATAVWDKVLEDQYRAFSRNCQSFAELFKEIIQNRSLLTDEKHMEVQDLPDSFNPLFVVLHLSQAKSVASRWTRRVLCKKDEAAAGHGRLPSKRSSRWLEIVNEQAQQHEFHDTVDFRGNPDGKSLASRRAIGSEAAKTMDIGLLVRYGRV